MREERVQRRLAAILAADVAGYSRLMGVDEEGTLSALKELRRDLADPKIKEHRGRIVKTTGDGLLVEFASVVDAVRCAVEVQFEMAERNAGSLKKISLPIAKFYSLSVDSRPHILFSKNAKKELIMGISMTVRTSGFRKWSEAHDPKIAVRAVAVEAAVISALDLDQGLMTPAEQPHRPWLVPGAGTL